MKDFELIYASQLRQKQRESRALVIDIRDRKEYEREHWPGAVSYPYDQLERGTARLPKNRKLILYCAQSPLGDGVLRPWGRKHADGAYAWGTGVSCGKCGWWL